MAVDVALLYDSLALNGWRITDDVANADLVLVAACAVHEGAEHSGFKCLAQVESRRRRDSRFVALGGR
jgi:tRNA A37 methylthiotransferase MiaB